MKDPNVSYRIFPLSLEKKKKSLSLRQRTKEANLTLAEAEIGAIESLFGFSARIAKHPCGAPYIFLEDKRQTLPISISHSGDYLVIAWTSNSASVGVDIQMMEDRITLVLPRICSESEIALFERHLQYPPSSCVPEDRTRTMLATAFWSAKEAFYKALYRLSPSVDFRRHYTIEAIRYTSDCELLQTISYSYADDSINALCRTRVTDDFCLSYVAIPADFC